MSRYIDADAVINNLPDDLPYKGSVKRVLMQAPAADVVEDRHGEWQDIGEKFCECPACNTMFEALPTKSAFKADNIYCRHCGAKMDGGRGAGTPCKTRRGAVANFAGIGRNEKEWGQDK